MFNFIYFETLPKLQTYFNPTQIIFLLLIKNCINFAIHPKDKSQLLHRKLPNKIKISFVNYLLQMSVMLNSKKNFHLKKTN